MWGLRHHFLFLMPPPPLLFCFFKEDERGEIRCKMDCMQYKIIILKKKQIKAGTWRAVRSRKSTLQRTNALNVDVVMSVGVERESRLAEFLCGRHMPKCTSLSFYFLISLELMPKRSPSLSNSQKKTVPVVNTHDALWSAIDKNECTKVNNISKEEEEEKRFM